MVKGGLGWLKAIVKTSHLWVWILAAHLALGAIYSVVIPLWEGYDEWAHYLYIEYLVSEHRLPAPGQQLVTEEGMPDETTQPPLYYVLCAMVRSRIGVGDRLRPVVNPYAFTGTGEGGVNVAVHDPQVEGFPYRGTVLAVHLVRLCSVLLSTVAVWATYRTGRLIFPSRLDVAVGAMAFASFAPQFLFVGSIVNNDVLAVTMSSLVLLLTAELIVAGIRPLRLALLGLALALGVVAKHTTLAMVPMAGMGLVAALAGWRPGLGRERAGTASRAPSSLGRTLLGWLTWGGAGGLLVAGVWALTVTPWGDRLFGPLRDYILSAAYTLGHVNDLPWTSLPEAFRYGFVTFWASFGWGNVEAARWVYWAFGALCAISALGLAAFLLQKSTLRRDRLWVGLLALTVLCAVALPLYRELLLARSLLKGRYILTALPAVSLLIVAGATQWAPSRLRSGLAAALGLGMFGLALATPFCYIQPVYAAPRLLSSPEIQGIPNTVGIDLGSFARIVGYDVGRGRVRAGQAIAVTLYWQCLAETKHNYTVAVKVLGADGQEYGGVHLYPGRGNFATSLWRPGDLFRETYWVPVSAEAPAPCLGQIGVALFEPENGPAARSAPFGQIKIRPDERPEYEPERPLDYRLGDQIALRGYDLEQTRRRVSLRLYWQALSRIEDDFTVFVHLTDADGHILGQADSRPRGGAYPTSLWDRNEIVADEYTLTIPDKATSGLYRIEVGLYRLQTLQRLPILDPDGRRLPDDELPLEITAGP